MVITLDTVESEYIQTQRVSTNTLDTVKSGVTVICVPPGMCAPEHLSLVISLPQTITTRARSFSLQKHW